MTDKEIDEIFNRTNDKFWAGKFPEVDVELAAIDVSKSETQLLIIWLSTCYRASDKLKEYKPFLTRCTNELKQREPQRWKRLVIGFDQPYESIF